MVVIVVPILQFATLFLTFSKTIHFLCLLLDTSLNMSISHITSTQCTAFEVILQLMQCINYLLTSESCVVVLHRVSKKLCLLIFCSFSVKYEPISIKIGRIVPEQTLNETVPKLPTSPKVCACTILGNLKCQI